jgi:hypothetical protein
MENKNSHKKLWFKSKMYGWGWQPSSWEGWAVLLLYVITITINFLNIDKMYFLKSDRFIQFSSTFIINTIFLLTVCYIKGEKPRWRWGK